MIPPAPFSNGGASQSAPLSNGASAHFFSNGHTSNGIATPTLPNGLPSNGPRPMKPPHVLIVGAGITGLVLAQSLRHSHPSVKFTVYERDPNASFRGAGWGLTMHWALPTLLTLLPPHILSALESTYVDPPATAAGDGKFLLYDLRTGQERYKVPPSRRIRVRREAFRKLLMEGVDVQWGKKILDITTAEKSHLNGPSVTAHFTDGTTASGDLLVGADGSRSAVRKILCPGKKGENARLPIRLLGASYACEDVKAEAIHKLDPFFLQASDPQTDTFFWFSFLNTPRSHPDRPHEYTCQVLTSWPFREGFRGQREPTEVPESKEEKVKLMKSFAEGWAEPFAGMVRGIPDRDADVKEIRLEDWVPPTKRWDNRGAKVTMVGDAAHAMTMYRGEAANHGIMDVAQWLEKLRPYFSYEGGDEGERRQLLETGTQAYEKEMIERARPAVLTSRKACMDAHEHEKIHDQSPLVSKRAVVTDASL